VSAPIGKGSRLLVLSGIYRGREGVIASEVRTRGGWWKVDIGEGEIIEVSPNDIEAGLVKRLADTPAEVDPLFVEIARMEAKRSQTWGGPDADDKRDVSEWLVFVSQEIDRGEQVIGEQDEGGDAQYRDAMMHAALYCLAAVRCIDRAHKPPR
jgi:hypothetical protein